MSVGSQTNYVVRAFRLVGENAAGITLVCTAFSLIVNFFRFRRWGLDYDAVVTPSDVIVGGINAFSTFFPFFIAAAGGLWAGQRTRRIFSNQKTRKILGITMALPMMAWVGTFVWKFDSIASNALIWNLSYMLVLMFWFEFLAITGETIFQKGESELALWSNLSIILSMMFSIYIIFSLDDLSTTTDTSLIVSERCADKEFVIWMGSESVVTSCQRQNASKDRDYFIVQREGLEFNVVDRGR